LPEFVADTVRVLVPDPLTLDGIIDAVAPVVAVAVRLTMPLKWFRGVIVIVLDPCAFAFNTIFVEDDAIWKSWTMTLIVNVEWLRELLVPVTITV
jgi:hypothetical protein